VERLLDAIEPDDEQGEPPLVPLLNHFKPIGTTAEVNFLTRRQTREAFRSHINSVVLDTVTWEASAAFYLEAATDTVAFYARNDKLGLVIPYEYEGIAHSYEPDYLVRLTNGVTLVLEEKGYETDQTQAKHQAAQRWVTAVNNWGKLGRWDFHVNRNPNMLRKELGLVARPG
jgi:type III restriction enzyme